jgi:hypothetical protein
MRTSSNLLSSKCRNTGVSGVVKTTTWVTASCNVDDREPPTHAASKPNLFSVAWVTACVSGFLETAAPVISTSCAQGKRKVSRQIS